VSITDPLARSINASVDGAGRLLSASDSLGQITRFEYNPLSEVTKITDAQGGATALAYDPNGNLTSLTDARNTSTPTVHTYDNMDRLQTRTDPLGNSESYQHDGNGNLTQFTDRRGKIAKFSYDALDRRTFVGYGWTGGTNYESTVNYTYDSPEKREIRALTCSARYVHVPFQSLRCSRFDCCHWDPNS
jgi:YD repeat-containing protein